MKTKLRLLKLLATAAVVYGLVCLLNILLGAYIWFPRYEWRWIFIPLPEAAAAVLILIGLGSHTSRSFSPKLARILLFPFTLLFLVLLLFSSIEAFFQHVYLRTFDIRANIPLVSHFFNMLFDTELFSQPLILILPALVVFGLMAALLWALFRYTTPVIGRLPRKPSLSIAAFALLLSIIAAPAQPAAVRLVEHLFFYEKSLVSAAVPLFDPSSSAESYIHAAPSFALPGIRDKNIHLVIVES
ncbi:MAG: hypothetical protein ACOC7X_04800, partial [Spirochaetota bacterium]